MARDYILAWVPTERSRYILHKWKPFFDQYDPYRRGEIAIEDFMFLLRHPQIRAELDPHTLTVLEIKAADPQRSSVSYQEFVNMMTYRRNDSFRLAVESRDTDHWKRPLYLSDPTYVTCFQKMVRRIAREFLTDDIDRQFYADRYTCCPPPMFIPFITLLEVGCFVYYCTESKMFTFNGPVPASSIFIYRPDKRLELWRFILYMFLHAGYVHLLFNVIVQVLVGIPLEMVHGSFRIALIYFAGILAGSLGTSVFDMNVYLVGSSGGVYALLAAHLANNYSHMELGILKLAAIFIVASADVGFAIWNRYTPKDEVPSVGYTAHLTGALAGLTVGLAVLKNFQQKLHLQYMCWVAMAVYLGCVGFAIFWNVFYY
ncbi:rhomboid-related protein 3-like isoform X3 [Biomphalaria glabrata]|uniref:rhomboid protease n=2 Tax=Biomphalaria glabrata TaxID=6526 RepID=A0A9W2ZQ69_BIOGL|nr:rhomboid-related protein 3-like isoform X3 [Biomphalaria glabrata]